MIYVASLYSHSDPNIKLSRLKLVTEVCARLVKIGHFAISPVVYGCTLIESGLMDSDDSWCTWQKFCEELISKSSSVYIIDIDGWKDSKGVMSEIEFATKNHISIYLLDPKKLTLSPLLNITD